MNIKTLIIHLRNLAKICNNPIDRMEAGLPWTPLGKGDTYLLRNTLNSAADVLKKGVSK